VVPYLEEDAASGRVEETILFLQEIYTLCKFFVKKIKKYHAAAGGTVLYRSKRPVCSDTERFCYLKGIAPNR